MIKKIIYDHCQRDKKQLTEKNTFSPSSMSKCRRALYYTMTAMQPSNPIDSHTYIKFALGNITHIWLQKILKESSRLKFIEMEGLRETTKFGLNWRYRLDFMCEIGGKKTIVEIKSTYMSGWNAVEKKPKLDHVMQLFAYMKLENVSQGILLYIGRDNGFMVQYVIGLDNTILDKRFNEKIKQLKNLQFQVKMKDLPDRDYTMCMKRIGDAINFQFTKDKQKYKTDWQCSYCNYRDLCWQYEMEKIKEYKFFINGKFHNDGS